MVEQLGSIRMFLEEDIKSGNIRSSEILKVKVEKAIEALRAAYSTLGKTLTITADEVTSLLSSQLQEHFTFLDNTIVLEQKDGRHKEVRFGEKRWRANLKYLKYKKNRSEGQVANLIHSLNTVMVHLVKNMDKDEFYIKSMVFKEVQSGKTEHFNSLINLAFDNNYEIAIILTGSQNDLRSQTQIRIDSDVIGQKSIDEDDEGDIIVGIGEYWDQPVLTNCMTDKSSEGDINGNKSGMKIVVGKDHPLIIVTKKNHDNLKALIKLLRNNRAENHVALVIDDEADLASIDTSYGKKTKKSNNRGKDPSDPEYVPSSINAHIRKLLKVFKRKAYVAYTATPYANLLVNRKIEHPEYGPDLYPKDVVLAIPSEDGYVGPKQWFGEKGIARQLVKRTQIEPKAFSNLLQSKNVLPDCLKEAMMSFVLATAIRSIREDEKEHNSMLIHTDMTTKIQDVTHKAVVREIKELVKLASAQNEMFFNCCKSLFINQFVRTTVSLFDQDLMLIWDDVRNIIPRVLKKIKVMKINGKSEDTLNYEEYKEKGLYVIAVGGNKLSRGLTLDGLTISYYLRESKNQDTLTQMGRWYGYKMNYLDMCRLYTTPQLEVAFATTVKTIENLMGDLTEMHYQKIEPDQFHLMIIEDTDDLPKEIKVLRNKKTKIKLKLTSDNKSHSGFRIARKTSWSGQLFQDTSFYSDYTIIDKNKELISDFLNDLPDKIKMNGNIRVWEKIDMSKVVNLLKKFRTPSNRCGEIVNYIEAIRDETKGKELKNCNIVLMSNRFEDSSEQLGNFTITRTSRQRSSPNHVNAVHVNNEEFTDLFLKDNDIKGQTRSDIAKQRNKDTAALLVYPIKVENSVEIISLAMSFPVSIALPENKTTYVVVRG